MFLKMNGKSPSKSVFTKQPANDNHPIKKQYFIFMKLSRFATPGLTLPFFY